MKAIAVTLILGAACGIAALWWLGQSSAKEPEPTGSSPTNVATVAPEEQVPALGNDFAVSDSETGSPPAPAEMAAELAVPKGFQIEVFAAEPMVRQPIDAKIDALGRVWVAEAYSYMDSSPRGEDRVVMLTDTDHDGRADRRAVFLDGLKLLRSVEVGFGGVWILDLPHLVFIPDANRDGVADGPPQVKLSGFSTGGGWNCANGLQWGPDGWLYGRQGQMAHSHLRGKDGGVSFSTAVWRYHPVSGDFEVIASGMTNPWGFDWNEDGEMFVSGNCNGHLWHIIPGALYQLGFGGMRLNYEFERLGPIEAAPHYQPAGNWREAWQRRFSSMKAADAFGGGHSHSGLLFLYNSWPPEFRGQTLMSNIHGRRLNRDRIETKGSSYVAHRVDDLAKSADEWFRGVSICDTHDGNVLVSDWCDRGECHDKDGIHRSSGRLYKIRHGAEKKRTPFDFPGATSEKLIALLSSGGSYEAKRAVRLLQERGRAGQLEERDLQELSRKIVEADRPQTRLRALWALAGAAVLDTNLHREALRDEAPPVRAGAVRFWADGVTPVPSGILAALAGTEPSATVRLHLASSLRAFPWEDAGPVAEALVARPEDAGDHTLQLVLWHALIQSNNLTPDRALALLEKTRLPKIREFLTRYLFASGDARSLTALLRRAAESDPETGTALLKAAATAASGRFGLGTPPGWDELRDRFLDSGHAELREAALALAVAFGDKPALRGLRETLADRNADPAKRGEALSALAASGVPDRQDLLIEAFQDAKLRIHALRGMRYLDTAILGDILVESWTDYNDKERAAAIDSIVTRPGWTKSLLVAMGAGKVPASDLSAAQARQIEAMGNTELGTLLARHWGVVRAAPDEQAAVVKKFTALLTDERAGSGDAARGKDIYSRHCGGCHVLFGDGYNLGPNLTGYNRHDVKSLLENIVSPNAVVAADARLTTVRMKDGGVVTGMLVQRDGQAVTIRAQGGEKVIALDQVASQDTSNESVMPPGLLERLPEQQLLDLFAYLQSDLDTNPQPENNQTR